MIAQVKELAAKVLGVAQAPGAAGSPEYGASSRDLYEIVKPYTFASKAKLENLRNLALKVREAGVPGELVECGTFRGGSAAVLASTLSGSQRLWAYDSFQGMPPVTAQDGPDAAQYVGKGVASEKDVLEVLKAVGVGPERVVIRKGWFAESFAGPLPEKISFLHCDADWYESVLLVLRTMYPRVALGGCIVLDDFGYWEGCREAFYTWCHEQGERPLLERFSVDQAWWFKGKTHNRSSV